MRTILSALRAAQKPVSLLLDILSVTLLALLVLIIAQDVFMRYVFSRPGKWSEELAIAMLIWFGYLGIAIGYRDNKHLSITVFADMLSPAGRKALDTFVDLAMLFFCVLMAWQGVLVTRLDAINIMPATGISMSWVSCVLVVSACVMIFEGLIKIVARFAPEQPSGEGAGIREETA